jgi:hypothetical protein
VSSHSLPRRYRDSLLGARSSASRPPSERVRAGYTLWHRYWTSLRGFRLREPTTGDSILPGNDLVASDTVGPGRSATNESADPGQQPRHDPRRRVPGRRLPPPTPPIRPEAQPRPAAPRPEPRRPPADGPVQLRMVWDGWTGEVEGVRIERPDGRTYIARRPAETPAAEVREAFAHVLAEDIVAAVWPDPSAGMFPPASGAELLTVTEDLLDPQLLAARLVGASVQVAAVHAGIPAPVARVMGQAARELFLSFSGPDPNARKVQAVRYVDLTLSAEYGSLINSPALPEIATGETADVIDRLLRPTARSPVRDPTPQPPPRPRPDRSLPPREGPGIGGPGSGFGG